MISIDAYEHFSFDLWMTIIKSNPDFKPKRAELLKGKFQINKSLTEINSVTRRYDILFNTISEKTGHHIPRDAVFLLILEELGIEIQFVSLEQLDDFFYESDRMFLNHLPLIIWDGIIELLETIKNEGKSASILSNTAFIHGKVLREVLQRLNLYDFFSFMIFSDEVGISKPNVKIFELMYLKILDLRKLEKSQILHIGDNKLADYEGANNFKINSLLIKHK